VLETGRRENQRPVNPGARHTGMVCNPGFLGNPYGSGDEEIGVGSSLSRRLGERWARSPTGKNTENDEGLAESLPLTPRFGWLRGPATTDIKDAQLRGQFDLDTLRGPAITEIDSPHLRGGRRLITELVSSSSEPGVH
jgi:hypothetical protein